MTAATEDERWHAEDLRDWYADDEGGGESPSDESWLERSIEVELDKLRIRKEAKRRLDEESREPIVLPPVKNLATLLAEPDEVTAYRIEGVAPVAARVMLSAQYKAGKTSLRDNLVRSLVDGDPFLGHFTVNTPAKHLVLIDDELSEHTLRPWLRAQNITPVDAVVDVIALRGKVSTFNILDEACRADWAQRLRDVECDYLVLDGLRPILDALVLDEKSDAGMFLVAFDALLNDAGIDDACLVQHMGHANERARGDSRLQDWPDAIWRIVRETEEPDSARFFSAYGRDVDVSEGRLAFDPTTRRLTYTAGSRQDTKTEDAVASVIDVIAGADEPLSGRAIEDALAGDHPRKNLRAAIGKTVCRGLVKVTDGPHRSKLHAIAHPCSECAMPVATGEKRHLSCSPRAEGQSE